MQRLELDIIFLMKFSKSFRWMGRWRNNKCSYFISGVCIWRSPGTIFVIFSFSFICYWVMIERITREQNFFLSLFLAQEKVLCVVWSSAVLLGGVLLAIAGKALCYTSHLKIHTHFYMQVRYVSPIKARIPCHILGNWVTETDDDFVKVAKIHLVRMELGIMPGNAASNAFL